MKFMFNTAEEVNTQEWYEINRRLEEDLLELASGEVDEDTAKQYLMTMIKYMTYKNNGENDGMTFLMFDDPDSMPSDARVEFVYKPTYIAATIMMTAMNRFPGIGESKLMQEFLHTTLNAAMGRNFMGSGWSSFAGLLDTLQIFAQGDTIEFMKTHREINPEFSDMLDAAIRVLETQVCSGILRDVMCGKDFCQRGEQVLKMLNKCA